MERVDYLIIGGGIAGITLRHFLKNDRTVVLEAEPGRYKIGESIIPEHFRHPALRELLPALRECPSFSPKYGTTFIDGLSAASFPLPEGALQGAMHITRTEMEQVMLDAWGVVYRPERVIGVDLEHKLVRTEHEEYQVEKQIIDCSGPNMVLSNLLKKTRLLWPVYATWSYWDIEGNEPERFYSSLKDRGVSWLRYSYQHRRVLAEEETRAWRPGMSTILTKIKEGMWTWQIPLYDQKLLSYGVVSRHGKVSREEYEAITSTNIAPNYQLRRRVMDGSSPYNRMHVRNNFARSSSVPATMDYILLSDAYCFADPVYSVGTGLAVNKAIEVATILNETGWTPEVCRAYCERYDALVNKAIAGFQFWYGSKVLSDDQAAATVQDELLVGNAFQSNITYHYVQALSYADLPSEVFASDPFSVDWDDPRLTAVSEKTSDIVGKLLGSGTVAGWTFSKARPASGGVLLRFQHEGLPEQTLLLSRAREGENYFRTAGPLGMRYLEIAEDDPLPDKSKIEQLADALVPVVDGRSRDWSDLVDKSVR